MKLRDVFISLDFIFAIIISIIVYFLFPAFIPTKFAQEVYNIGISILSIVFSVYFASLAIIISSSNDDFVSFLEDGGEYSRIIKIFEFSLQIGLFPMISLNSGSSD